MFQEVHWQELADMTELQLQLKNKNFIARFVHQCYYNIYNRLCNERNGTLLMKLIKNTQDKSIAIAYNFKQFFGSNLDIFYFLSVICIFKDKKIIRKSFKYILPIVIYGIFQSLTGDLNNIKLVVNIAKIYLCILLFLYVKRNAKKIKINKIVYYTSILYIVSIPIALLLKHNTTLWIFNDLTNRFTQTRLRLFYSEASELAFHVSLVIIFTIYLILKSKDKRRKNIVFLLLLSFVIYLSAGLGAICILSVSLIMMFIIKFFKKPTFKKFIIYYFAGCLLIILSFFYFRSSSALVLRLGAILNGSDSSVNYRLFTSYNVMKAVLVTTNMKGIGFGNLNTDYISFMYYGYGLIGKIANSFMYFISEGGLFSIIYLAVFYLSLLKNINKKNAIIKIPLLFFIFVYQISGGYFTNPTNWIICGLIASKYDLVTEPVFASKTDIV